MHCYSLAITFCFILGPQRSPPFLCLLLNTSMITAVIKKNSIISVLFNFICICSGKKRTTLGALPLNCYCCKPDFYVFVC